MSFPVYLLAALLQGLIMCLEQTSRLVNSWSQQFQALDVYVRLDRWCVSLPTLRRSWIAEISSRKSGKL